MKSINQWLNEYGESHTNPTNKTIHWLCVPAIFFSIVAWLWCIKLPFVIFGINANVSIIAVIAITIYYASLSRTIWVGMLLFEIICLWISYLIEEWNIFPLWSFALVVFVIAWIGQFYGHKIEGKKPSFLKDLQFLLIGPMWLMSFVYKNLGIKY